MAEYIERGVVLATLSKYGVTRDMRAHKAVAQLPIADVAPVVYGKWIPHNGYCECNICKKFFGNYFNYCDGRCVVLPCKPVDDLCWHDAVEGTTRLIKNGVNGVVVFEEKFAILNYDSSKDEWSIIFLPDGDGIRKTEAKPQNQHFLQRFMEVK